MQELSTNNQYKHKSFIVAIYLPVFNSKDVIEDTLKSFINQTQTKLKILFYIISQLTIRYK